MNDNVCIIGAGASGIVAAKTLKQEGIPYDCFEMGSDIGGLWRYENDNGRSAAYRSLHINTSKDRMAFSDFPMPNHLPNYPRHDQIIRYFEAYVDHFSLRSTITFRVKVVQVTPMPAGGYEVTICHLETGQQETRHYRAVLVCSGHHWSAKIPEFAGTFTGETLHSNHYRDATPYKDKRVMVVGIGNSGVDIACDACHLAEQVFLSTRRSAHIIPRYLWGYPSDKFVNSFSSHLPFSWQRASFRLVLALFQGNQESYGVPKPEHDLFTEHPTLSDHLLNRVAQGDVNMKPNIARFEGKTVHFVDGTSESVDVIVFATGYHIRFPFLPDEVLTVQDNALSLYQHVVHPEREGLYFIGLVQPLGPIMPLSELQSQWVAGVLNGRYTLPTKTKMYKTIHATQEKMHKRYIKSARHTIQVDYFPYIRTLQQEMRPKQPAKWVIAGGITTVVALILTKFMRKTSPNP